MLKQAVKRVLLGFDRVAAEGLKPINLLLAFLLRRRVIPNSVLHVSYMVHTPYHTVGHLRRQGMRADFLAIGTSPYWSKCDFNFQRSPIPLLGTLQEFWIFWRVVARYEILHSHFMFTISQTGWELPILKRMGRKLVAHFRGCEARDRERNMAMHPKVNICQTCDHNPYICQTESAARRRQWAQSYADAVLVTTPDMRDFVPEAIHFPFFAPADTPPQESRSKAPSDRAFTIVHATNQPGIEGTREIEQIVERLRAKGRNIRFVWLRDIPHEEVLGALAEADVSVGKMKMGYYANAQIESMAYGVPTITFVRDAFMTEELRNSGFIFTVLAELETTIERLMDDPELLEAKRRVARASILRLHDNEALARRLVGIYRGLGAAPRALPLLARGHTASGC